MVFAVSAINTPFGWSRRGSEQNGCVCGGPFV